MAGAAVILVLVWLALVLTLWVRRPGETTARELLRLLPDQCRWSAPGPAWRNAVRSTRATTTASSAQPNTGTKSGMRSIGMAR